MIVATFYHVDPASLPLMSLTMLTSTTDHVHTPILPVSAHVRAQ